VDFKVSGAGGTRYGDHQLFFWESTEMFSNVGRRDRTISLPPRVIVAPPVEPVSFELLSSHLRLDDFGGSEEHPQYSLLSSYLTAARELVEKDTRRALVQQTLQIKFEAFADRVELLRPPFIGALEVAYLDEVGATQTLDPDNYQLDDYSDITACLYFVEDLPLVLGDRRDAVTVTWQAGYLPEGSPLTQESQYLANVPRALQTAILLRAQMMYEDFAPDEMTAYVRAYEALIGPHRVGRL